MHDWTCVDQRRLRHVVPEDRLRIYDARRVVEALADEGSVLELRREFGPGMMTALIRIEGRPIGLVANNPIHLAGAVDSDGADKAARFMQICDAFDLPILCLCDTPGNMVGPEAEKTALVRHCCRLYVTGSSVTVPMFTVVLRKSYGLGAQAMAAGSFHAPFFAVSWPTGEFGGMGLEGAVKLGYRKELAAIEDPAERMARYEEMSPPCTSRGRRSTRPPCSRSTTSSTPRTPGAGSWRGSGRALRPSPAAARSAPASTPGSACPVRDDGPAFRVFVPTLPNLAVARHKSEVRSRR